MPKIISFFLISITIFIFIFFSWSSSRPDNFLSTLDGQFPIGEDVNAVVRELENLQFDYTLYEYSFDRFRVISGTPAVTPLLTFPDAPIELLEDCNEIRCSVIRSSKLEYVYVLGVLRFHHIYRYLWIFHRDQVAGSTQNNGYWGIIR